MSRSFTKISCVIVALSVAGTAMGAPKVKPPAKRIVQGTHQLNGEAAQFAETYTLGRQNPINVTLTNAEFTVEPVLIGKRLYSVDERHKLLVLHMTVHNPNQRNFPFRWDSLGYTAVDSADQNHDGLLDLGAEVDKSRFQMSLLPAQKVAMYGIMKVPAELQIPKLILKSMDSLVLRYDLRGKVRGLPPPYADPSDSSGATALATISAGLNTEYPLGDLSMRVTSSGFSDASQIGDKRPRKGQRYFIVAFTLRNCSPMNSAFRWDTFRPRLLDVDGVEICGPDALLRASSDVSFAGNLAPGQQLPLRYAFSVPDGLTPKSLTVTPGRRFQFDLEIASR